MSPQRGANRASNAVVCWWSGSAKQLDDAAVAYVGRMLKPYRSPTGLAAVEAGWERVRAEAAGEDDTPRRIAGAEARRTKYVGARDSAYIDWKAGEILAEQYQSVRVRAEAEITICDRELRSLRTMLAPKDVLPPWGEVLAFTQQLLPVFERGTTAERRLVLSKLWEKAVPVKLGFGRYDVEPELTELGHRLLQVSALVGGADKVVELYKSAVLRTVK
jgi:hypothetical protein